MKCYSTHLTTFTLQKVTLKPQTWFSSIIKPEHKEKLWSPITYLVIMNIALVLFLIIGVVLDQTEKLIFKPTYKDDKENP